MVLGVRDEAQRCGPRRGMKEEEIWVDVDVLKSLDDACHVWEALRQSSDGGWWEVCEGPNNCIGHWSYMYKQLEKYHLIESQY